MFEYRELRLELRLFAFPEVRGRQFIGLEAQPLLVAAPLLGFGAQGRGLAAQFRYPGVLCRIAGEQLAVAGHGVERRGAELLGGEDQVLVLRMDIHQAGAHLAELAERYGHVVDEGAALARRGDDPGQGRLCGVVEVVFGEIGFQSASLQVEGPLYRAVARGVLHGRSVVLGPQQQPEGAEQNRLAGTRFARDDVQVRVQLHFEFVDERVVFDRESA